MAGQEHDLRAARRGALEDGDEPLFLALAAVELLGDLEIGGGVVRAGEEIPDGASCLELRHALFEIGDQAIGGLITVLRVLGEELHDHGGDGRVHRGADAVRGLGRDGNVAVDERHRVDGVEREAAGEHLVQGDTERVHVGPVVDRAVHAPCLLGRNVGQCAFEAARAGEDRVVAAEARGDVEVGELDCARGGVDVDVRRLDVAVNDVLAVEGAEDLGELARDAEGLQHLDPALAEQGAERDAAEVFHDHDDAVAELLQPVNPGHARQIQALADRGAVP